MTELLSSLRSSLIERLTSPHLRGLREIPIARISLITQEVGKSWGERFNPAMRKRYLNYAKLMAETLNKGRLLHTDSFYQALEPKQHYIASNLLAQLVPEEEFMADFVTGQHYKSIEGYFLGIVSHKIPLYNSFTNPDNYKDDFSNYIFHDSDYGDRGKMRVFLRNLIMQQPTLSFLNRERRSGELPYF